MRDTLDVKGAAEFLKISVDAVRRKARMGEIPGAKIGRRWVFLAEDLAATIREAYSSQYTSRKAQRDITLTSPSAARRLEDRVAQLTRPKRSNTSKR